MWIVQNLSYLTYCDKHIATQVRINTKTQQPAKGNSVRKYRKSISKAPSVSESLTSDIKEIKSVNNDLQTQSMEQLNIMKRTINKSKVRFETYDYPNYKPNMTNGYKPGGKFLNLHFLISF